MLLTVERTKRKQKENYCSDSAAKNCRGINIAGLFGNTTAGTLEIRERLGLFHPLVRSVPIHGFWTAKAKLGGGRLPIPARTGTTRMPAGVSLHVRTSTSTKLTAAR
jgi:hypothetical protein